MGGSTNPHLANAVARSLLDSDRNADRKGSKADYPGNRPLRLALAAMALLIGAQGCSGAWRAASSQDTPAAYHRYLRENPNSWHAEEARERLAFHKLIRSPSFEGYVDFLRVYPDSTFARQLEPVLEDGVFQAALAENSVAGWQDFSNYFPNGSLGHW